MAGAGSAMPPAPTLAGTRRGDEGPGMGTHAVLRWGRKKSRLHLLLLQTLFSLLSPLCISGTGEHSGSCPETG